MPTRFSAPVNLHQRTHCGVRAAGLVAALLLSAPVAVSAQDPVGPGAWYLSPTLGVSLDPDGQTAPTIAGALGYALTRQVTLEGEVSHIFNYTHGESSDPADLVIIDDVPSAWRFAGALTLRLGS